MPRTEWVSMLVAKGALVILSFMSSAQSQVSTTMPTTTPTLAPSSTTHTAATTTVQSSAVNPTAVPSNTPTISPIVLTSVAPPNALNQDDDASSTSLFMTTPVLAAAGCGIIVLLVIAVVFIRRRRWRSRQKARLERQDDVSVMRSVEESAQSRRPSSLTDEEELVNMMLPWEEVGDVRTYPRQPYQKPSTDVGTLNADLRRMKIVDIPISQVQTLQAIDTGHIQYHVRKAIYTAGPSRTIDAAVKSIEGPGTGMVNDKLRCLLREVAAMSQFEHGNVVKLIGVVWNGTPLPGHPMVLYEHMGHGLLDRYLRKSKPDLQKRLAMCKDVAAGVSYLASVQYVLGNLSSKVVMVHKNERCKVGDFFIGKDISDATTPLPRAALSWYAPELYRQCDAVVNPLWRKSGDSGLAGHSLASTDEDPRQISHEADVWALGMVLWETWCNAEVAPYHKVPTSKVVGMVRHGRRPGPPSGCPKSVYAIMIDCWHPTPSLRTTAATVVDALPHSLDCEVVPTTDDGGDRNARYLDLHEKYVDMLGDDDVASEPVRAPSPLIHVSLVGLKKQASDVKESVVGFSTLSSRPSNYTSESGSNPSLNHSPEHSPMGRDKDKPTFTRLFDRVDDDDGPLPSTLLRSSQRRTLDDSAIDGYLQISPTSPLYEPEPKTRLTRSMSARTNKTARTRPQDPSPERRKSALALAMQGIDGAGPDSGGLESSRLTIPAWAETSHRRSNSGASGSRDSRSREDARSTLSSRRSAGSTSDLASILDQRPQSASGSFKTVTSRKSAPSPLVHVGRHRSSVLPDSAVESKGGVRSMSGPPAVVLDDEPGPALAKETGNKSGGWFKRSRRSSTALQSPELTSHSSPEPGALPDGPFTTTKSRRQPKQASKSRDDDRSSSTSTRESSSPVGGPYTGGLTLTASALHRIGRQLNDQFDK